MSKRFGRNQKRKARNEIARLSRELDLAITGGFARATGRWPALDPLIGIPIFVETLDAEDGFSISRTTKLRFLLTDYSEKKGVLYHMAYSGAVEWRGVVWRVAKFQPTSSDTFMQDQIIELELEAIGDRDERRPVTRSYFPTYNGKLAA